jgi:uncharacterized protein
MGESAAEEIRVQDNPDQGRYEALVGGEVAGYVTYDRRGGEVIFVHTLVEPAFEGKGVGGRLASGALDDVRHHGGSVVAKCPFIAEYIERHPAYHDLLAAGGPA